MSPPESSRIKLVPDRRGRHSSSGEAASGEPDRPRAGIERCSVSELAARLGRRIVILGSPGAGKTTLARRLAAASGLPLWSMDELYWEPGWRRPDEAAVARRLADAVAGPAWIIEGNYERYLAPRLARADSAVFLDVGPVRCLIRIARRGWRRGGRVDWRFVRKVAGFSRRERPRMLSVLERWSSTGKQVIVL